VTGLNFHNTAFQTQKVTHNQSCYAVVFYYATTYRVICHNVSYKDKD